MSGGDGGGKVLLRRLALLVVTGIAAGVILDRVSAPPAMPDFDESSRVDAFQRFNAAPTPAAPAEEQALDPTVKAAMRGMPSFPGAKPASLGGAVSANGLSLPASWFFVPESPEEVMQHYLDRLGEAGLPVISQRFSGDVGYVGYREEGSELLHSITVMPHSEGQTLVLVGAGDPKAMIRAHAEGHPMPEGLPKPPGGSAPTVYTVEEVGFTQHTVSSSIPAGDLEEILSFYKNALTERGWRIDEATRPSNAQALLTASSEGKSATLTLQHRSEPGKDPVLRFVLLITERA